ncbi:MAG: NADPH-dependent glutamate synthase [Candidatus Eisenbacteria bacterium]|nr:NADPH-dependent glutamate synthase [Candidatus Latescibacterota bacterium]MBD3303469.1 NADPH-dependent glutamate synthase [Candidatus Eisenbacteria bacterium]
MEQDQDRAQAKKKGFKQKTKTPMPMQDPEVRIENFSSVELGYDESMAFEESNRCIQCKDPFCVPYCPVEIDIRSMMDAVNEKDYEKAYQIICKDNLFPAITGRVCPQESQCEMVCIRGKKGEPVGIGFLEKFLADWARERGIRPKAEVLPPNGKKIAIIGSGPAGMSAAADLIRLGYAVTIYEALHRAGGVLIYGIPEFRLPKHIVDFEIENLRSLGVEIVLNTLVGRTITMDELIEEHDAIFIGTGAGLPYFMNIPGEQLSGVYSANEYLTRANLMNARSFPEAPTPIHQAKRVAVVGGGNVAMDAARVAKRLGADEVDVVYRRTKKEMPARADEISHAEEEHINFLFLHAPVAIHGNEDGWIDEVELIQMELGEPDDSGRRRPVVIPGSNFRKKYDILVMAIGQGPNPLLARLTPYLKTTKWGQLVIDPDRLKIELDGKQPDEQSAAPDIPILCAGGDIIGSQAGPGGTVIAAMGHGKIAARTIHEELEKREPKQPSAE